MNRTADSDAALGFVTRRIKEEATRSGESLTHEHGFLLNHLPKASPLPQAYGSDPESPVVLVPSGTAYERLCALAKSARNGDLRLNPASVLDWGFAAAVSKLDGHPMSWLLPWAGVKVLRPWRDRWRLIAAALLFSFSVATGALLATSKPWSRSSGRASVFGYIVVLILCYFASRRIEEWHGS